MKIPYWKLKRELRRIKDQLLGALIYPLEVFRTRRYDREKRQILRIRMGANPLSDKIAVFLVGHPASQRGGIEHTLKHLVEQGLSVLLVINDSAKCMEDDWYLSYCSAVISRPNYGYDFGGYRDGLLWLKEQDHALSELLLINDSIWFPLLEGDRTLARARESGVDVFGLRAIRESSAGLIRHQVYGVASSFLLLSGRVVQRPEFWAFWSRLVMSNIKRSVIKRGEHRLNDIFCSINCVLAAAVDSAKISYAMASPQFNKLLKSGCPALKAEVKNINQRFALVVGTNSPSADILFPFMLSLGPMKNELTICMVSLGLSPALRKAVEYIAEREALKRFAASIAQDHLPICPVVQNEIFQHVHLLAKHNG